MSVRVTRRSILQTEVSATCYWQAARQWLPCLTLVLLLLLPLSTLAGIPHLGQKGHEDYQAYTHAENNRAFIIAPGGSWAWVAGEITEAAAISAATEQCQRYTPQRCVIYSVNGELRFDSERWPTLWQPYKSDQQARSATTGVRLGQRFPDLQFKQADGAGDSIGQRLGQVTLVHFWGAWCPPCMRELPHLSQLHQQLQQQPAVELVMLQAREPIAASWQFVRDNGFATLPLYDSGADSERSVFRLTDGSELPDRYFAPVFPTTYVLDRRGIVVFSHHGPIEEWDQYRPFIDDAAANSGL